MKILVTGGAGFIGTHTCVELLIDGYEVVVIDNLSNSTFQAIERVEKIAGKSITFKQFDLLDTHKLDKVFSEHKFDAVMHFAGLKSVAESVLIPIDYYMNNFIGTLNLCKTMANYHVKKLIFSSSATVYGNPTKLPIVESSPLLPSNPYGRIKMYIEKMLGDIYAADHEWMISILRYFNPVGAHQSGLIGEDPGSTPNNLMPVICQTAMRKTTKLKIFGDDYPTKDGTGVRDYIHIDDLVKGHITTVDAFFDSNLNIPGVNHFNLGTGKGISVLELIKTFESCNGVTIEYECVARRLGDVAISFADPELIENLLGWKAKKDIDDMCIDAWNWQLKNPTGYRSN